MQRDNESDKITKHRLEALTAISGVQCEAIVNQSVIQTIFIFIEILKHNNEYLQQFLVGSS